MKPLISKFLQFTVVAVVLLAIQPTVASNPTNPAIQAVVGVLAAVALYLSIQLFRLWTQLLAEPRSQHEDVEDDE